MYVEEDDLFIDRHTGQYPLTLRVIRQTFTRFSLPQQPTYTQLEQIGFLHVLTTSPPKGDVVEEEYPQRLEDGRYVQRWRARDFTEKEKQGVVAEERQERLGVLNQQYEITINNGFPVELNGVAVHIPLRGEYRARLTETLVEARLRLEEDDPTPLSIAVKESFYHQASPEEIQALCREALEFCRKADRARWELQQQLYAAQDLTDLPEIPTGLLGMEVPVLVTDYADVDLVNGIDRDGNPINA